MADSKECCRCGVLRPTSQFGPRKENRDGLRGYCKPCDAAQAQKNRDADRKGFRKYRREYYRKNPEPFKQQAAKWNQNNKERVTELRRARIAKDPEKFAAYYRKSWLKKYRLTPEQFDAMYEQQNGLCAICGLEADETLCVDHCHESGKVRGLLCRKCNSGIGMLQDDMSLTVNAAEYLAPKSLDELITAARSF